MSKSNLWSLGLILEYLTLVWNVIGTPITFHAGLQSGSIALIGFSLDSVIEIGASIIVIWQLNDIKNKQRERLALRLIGSAFLLQAVYVMFQSVNVLFSQSIPQSSTVGIIWQALTFIVMISLAAGKAYTGNKLDNITLKTEARVTLIDACLAASVLIGLLLNSLLGWWWSDPLAGFVIVFYGFKEGWHTWMESPK
ncbi:cation transporter (plasmid) [Pseudanabaena biceps]|nr:cation transporter [Pseudanabaena biceps]